jgi:hypothetical protein
MKTWKHAIIGIIALTALAFTACKDGNDTKTQEPWTLTVTGTFLAPNAETPTPYSVTFIDQTNGDPRLKDPDMALKLNQAFAIFSERAKTDGMIGSLANIVLPRGIKINIVNSGESFDGFQVLNYNTIRCHIDFLTSANDAFISGYFESVLSNLSFIHAKAGNSRVSDPQFAKFA